MPKSPGAINGGLFAREGELKTPIITVDVDDIDATLAQVEKLGGSVVKPKDAIPGMGFYAYFKDTEGNVLGLWQNLPAGTAEGTAG
jgi:predicted enzyme related to lactoylglutathione lyase